MNTVNDIDGISMWQALDRTGQAAGGVLTGWVKREQACRNVLYVLPACFSKCDEFAGRQSAMV